MIELPESLKSHLSGDATTLCYAWILTRKDDQKLGFTDHDRSINIDGVSCEPSSGFTSGAIENALGLAGDTSEVEGALSSDAISDFDVEAGLYDGAKISQYLVNWSVPDEYAVLRQYSIGEITQEDEAFRVELRSFAANLDQPSGRYFLRHCDATLGDSKCAVDLTNSAYMAAGSVVDNALSSLQTIVSDLAFDFLKHWFSSGRLIWRSGALADQEYEVAAANYAPDGAFVIISLVQALQVKPSAGDEFDLVAGCDKRFATCKSKFENAINFRGFPHMPGNDSALTYVDSESDYDGDPLVP